MKLLVRNDFIIGQCKDDIDIPIPDGAGVQTSELVENWNDAFKIGFGFEYFYDNSKSGSDK